MNLLKKYWLEIFVAILLIVASVYLYNYFSSLFDSLYNNAQTTNCHEIYGYFGSYFGGIIGPIISVITLFLVFITYNSQRKDTKLQRQLVAQQQFESTFFNMLNVHRELKNDLTLNIKNTIVKLKNVNNIDDIMNGVTVFKLISEDYKNFYKLFDSHGKLIKVKELNKGKTYDKLIKNHKKTGDDNSDSETINDSHFEVEESNKSKNIVDEKIWNENQSSIEFQKVKIDFTFKLLFENYQDIISHYCRNVYHILKFIQENETQNLKSYRKYADIFQSQLNVYEQFILYYNFYHFDDKNKEILSTIKLVEHYQFLENLGLNNLIIEKHKELYPNLNLK